MGDRSEAVELTGEAVELLQALIRNACVNDGTVESGQEIRSAELLQHYLEGAGLDVERFEQQAGRTSIVARIEGSDPDAPSLCFMGHTDVVPVNAASWTHDPFGGELIDGEVWGRGAIDMLNLTATMAVAFRHLARSGFTPKGTLIFYGVADEEAGGSWGAEWMVDRCWDAIGCDYLVSELGGWSERGPDGVRRVAVSIAEKGIAWRRLTIHGTPGHGSMPYGADNALIAAAEVVRRLAEYRAAPSLDDVWRAGVDAMDVPPDLKAALLDPDQIDAALAQLPVAQAKSCHARTHTTFSPNVLHAGQKTNVIPDLVELEVDIRTLPGVTPEDVDGYLQEALGDLFDRVTVDRIQTGMATRSTTDTPLWDALATQISAGDPNVQLQPTLMVGGTDARFFRNKGTVAFGTGLFSPAVTAGAFAQRFHGNDERVDVDSLTLTLDLWLGIARQLLT